jgi:pimeloyl-ACP methyl ester carboxylesterase
MNIINTPSFSLATNARGDKNSDKLALVLPGRLDTKDYACFNSHLELLASKGFYSISFDPPGTWESPGGIGLFTTTNYIKAVNELIEYFGNKPTFVMGHSRGGATTILASAENPHIIAIAPIMATYGEPSPPDEETKKTGVKTSKRDLPPGTSRTDEQKEFLLPINYFMDGQKHHVIEALMKFKKPKLIFYGSWMTTSGK